jgi:DNA-binding HxlR family transcriptional regulator
MKRKYQHFRQYPERPHMPLPTDAQTLLDGWARGNLLAPDCPSRPILQHLTSRWGALVMIVLATGTHRFSALRRKIGGISERMLAQTLQDLEADGMILRTAHAVVPPHVDYALTPLGAEAAVHVVALAGFVEGALGRVMLGRAA